MKTEMQEWRDGVRSVRAKISNSTGSVLAAVQSSIVLIIHTFCIMLVCANIEFVHLSSLQALHLLCVLYSLNILLGTTHSPKQTRFS